MSEEVEEVKGALGLTESDIAEFYHRLDSCLLSRDVPVYLSHTENTASTDGHKIVLSAEIAKESLATLRGLNYHEVGHIMFSPGVKEVNGKILRKVSELSSKHIMSSWDAERQMKNLHNILEDCRIENLMVKLYPKLGEVLKVPLYRLILNNKRIMSDSVNQTLFIWGRKYVPLKLRKKVYDPELSPLIDKFLTSTSLDERIDVVAEIMLKIKNKPVDTPYVDGGYSKDEKLKKWEDIEQNASEELKKQIEEEEEQMKEQEEESKESEDEETEAEEEGEEDEGVGEGEEEEEGEGEGEGEEGEETEERGEDIFTLLEDWLDDNEERIEGEVLEEHLSWGKGAASWTNQPPAYAQDLNLAQQLAQVFEILKTQAKAGWDTGQRAGRIDLRAAMRATMRKQKLGYMDSRIFRRYRPDREKALKMDVCFVVDVSASMEGLVDKALSIQWAIDYAVRRAGGKTSLIFFSDDAKLAKSWNQSNVRVPRLSYGGTYPASGFELYLRELLSGAEGNKVLFLISDGDYSVDNLYFRELVDKLKQAGVKIIQLKVKEGGWDENAYPYPTYTVEEGSLPMVLGRIVKEHLLSVVRW